MPEVNRKLQKTLRFRDAFLFGIGGMLGAGVYAIIGEAANLSGNSLWLSFVIAAIIAFLTALTYAEFVSRFPDSGGSFEYIKQSLGKKTALTMGIAIAFTGIVAAAAIAISFAGYLGRLIDIPQWIAMTGILLAMGLINVFGIQSSSGFNIFATVVTVLGLFAIVVVAIPHWGEIDLIAAPPRDAGIFLAAALLFFSYVGFEDLVKMAEETRNPDKVLPKALILSSLFVLAVYVLVAISSIAVLDWQTLGKSKAPLSAVIQTKAGKAGAIGLAVVALFATSKTILSNILGTSRLFFDISRDTNFRLLNALTHVGGKFRTPAFAIALVTVLAILFGLTGDLSAVASLSNVLILTVFTTVNFSLIVWRLRNPADIDCSHFKVPLSIGGFPVLPAIGVTATLTMLGFNLINIFN